MSDHRRSDASCHLSENSASAPVAQVPEAMQESAEARSREVLFIDGGLHDWSKITANVRPDVEVIVFDPQFDPLAQIADAFSAEPPPEAIHIATRGDSGHLNLGEHRIRLEGLPGYATPLSALRGCLVYVDEAMLYGCEFSHPDEARQFLKTFFAAGKSKLRVV